MTLTVEYTGALNLDSDETILKAALSTIGSCCVENTYWESDAKRRFVFQFLDSDSATAMSARIEQAGVILSRRDISE